jgi:hypothetical protein
MSVRRDPVKPVVQLRTDGVLRSPAAKEYNAGARMYGLVDSQLAWVMDMAAVGQSLQSHVSAQLKARRLSGISIMGDTGTDS